MTIEIVFEEVLIDSAVNLIEQMIRESQLINFQISTEDRNGEFFQATDIDLHHIKQSWSGAYYFNFMNFNLQGIKFSNLGCQIYKYEKKTDLNLHFDEIEIDSIPVSLLHTKVMLLAKQLGSRSFYCGCEPAIDHGTRFFTDKKIGPLRVVDLSRNSINIYTSLSKQMK